MFRLRDAESSDFEFVAALWDEDADLGVDASTRRGAHARAFARLPLAIVDVGDDRVGLLVVDWDAPFVTFGDLRLRPTSRGRGLGTRVAASVLERARREGRTVVTGDAVIGPRARAFLARLGFESVDRGRVGAMRWGPDRWSSALRALAPWADADRAPAWLRRWFHTGDVEQGEFAAFALARRGLEPSARVLVATGTADIDLGAVCERVGSVVVWCGEPAVRSALAATASLHTVEALPRGPFEAAVVLDGGPGSQGSHRARCESLAALVERIVPGGPVVVMQPNVPWLLAHELAPLPTSSTYHDATLTRMIERTPRLHEGMLLETEDWFVEVGGMEVSSHRLERRRPLVTRPALLEALSSCGVVELETFSHRRAQSVGPSERRELLLVGVRELAR